MDARLFNEPGRIVLVQPESDCGNEALTDDVGVVVFSDGSGSVDLEALIRFLSEQECNEVLIESGPKLSGAFLAQGLVDEIWVYQSAGLLGDSGRAMFELDGVNDCRPNCTSSKGGNPHGGGPTIDLYAKG